MVCLFVFKSIIVKNSTLGEVTIYYKFPESSSTKTHDMLVSTLSSVTTRWVVLARSLNFPWPHLCNGVTASVTDVPRHRKYSS